MSASRIPTDAPSASNASARLTAVVDLPTPPLPEATAMMFLMPGTSLTPRCTACGTTREFTVTDTAAAAGRCGARAGLRERLRHLPADRLVLALAGIAELDLERRVVAGELEIAHRARGD